ncbi:hypothetical protein CLOLEP_01891 [[Clostridium] leptum DSM 753]|uniref:Uncharacterized protein n=1 Tax=[Clostridium] leptum DSM 753 TaxID=428125 RepID=A7VTJ7_9FIRM|nr:hypothetical protein CLOLEP_01891 [[Clostridium] leptum DSM 753]
MIPAIKIQNKPIVLRSNRFLIVKPPIWAYSWLKTQKKYKRTAVTLVFFSILSVKTEFESQKRKYRNSGRILYLTSRKTLLSCAISFSDGAGAHQNVLIPIEKA